MKDLDSRDLVYIVHEALLAVLHLPDHDPIRLELLSWRNEATIELRHRIHSQLIQHLARFPIKDADPELLADEIFDLLLKPGLCKPARTILAWLKTCATNKALSFLRRPRPLHFEDVRDAEGNSTPGESLVVDHRQPTPEELAMAAELREQIDRALATLPPLQRRVLEEFRQGLRPEQIACLLNLPVKTIYHAKNRGLDRLRASLPATLLNPC